jgi:cytoskeletal protein RodZ
MASFGDELKRERELRDISVREIADATNIPARFLEALEQNNFKILPGGAYNRGFVRSYARHIGINVEDMVNAYHQEAEKQEAVAQSQGKRMAPPTSGQGSGGTAGLVAGIAVIAAAAGFAMIYYWAGTAMHQASAPLSAPNAHNVALKARVKKSGALPSTSGPLPGDLGTEPAPGTSIPTPPEPAGSPAVGPERLVRVRALETTWVQLSCAGVAEFRGDLWVGSERHFPCREPMLLSADNAGAVECSVDSSDLQLLGERGEMVRDRPIPLQKTLPEGVDAPPSKPKVRPAPAGLEQTAGRVS